MDENREKRPVLESADALKGRKAKPRRKLNKWLILLLCAVVFAAGFGVYNWTDLLKPDAQEAEEGSSGSSYVKVPLIEKEAKDFDRLTVYKDGSDPYTIFSNMRYDEEGNLLPNPTYPPEDKEEEIEVTPAPTVDSDESDAQEEADDAEYYPNYSLEGMPYFTLDTSQADSLVSYAKTLTAQHTVEEAAKDLSIYGLDDPEVVVEFQYRDGSKEKLLIGDKAPTSTYCYAMREGDGNVYIIFSSIKTAFSKALNTLHELKNPVQMDETTIQDLIIEQKGKETIELKVLEETAETMGVSTLRIVRPIVYDAHSTRAQEMFTGVASLTVNAYAGHFEDEAGKAAYGLDQPNMRLYFEDAEGHQNDISVGNKTDDGNYYVTVDSSGDVYTMSQAALAFVSNANVGYLVDQFTNLINIQKVDEIIIEAEGDVFTLHIENEADPEDASKTLSTYYFDGEERDETSFKKIYQEIIGLLFDKVSDDYHFEGNVFAKVTYKFNNEWENFVVEYIEYDRDYYAARRDGQTLFLIKREKVQKMLEYLNQYREGTYVYS